KFYHANSLFYPEDIDNCQTKKKECKKKDFNNIGMKHRKEVCYSIKQSITNCCDSTYCRNEHRHKHQKTGVLAESRFYISISAAGFCRFAACFRETKHNQQHQYSAKSISNYRGGT